jgi:serine/threonine-protein kinase
MGIVFRAVRDRETVAVKVLKEALSDNRAFERRFLRESRVAAAVQHKHLVPIVDAGEADGRHYLAARYVPGGSLAMRLRTCGRLAVDETLRLVTDIGAGVDALHRLGLVHRDVKPSNVMLDDDGTAALTDFGLAKGPAYTVLTKPGTIVGTIGYLAPEVLLGEEATAASDIYALGCVAYECLAGAAPFASDNVLEAIAAHLDEDAPDVSAERDDIPTAFGATIGRALAKQADERPRTARSFAHMLAASR